MTELFVEKRGEGRKAVVMLHGWNGNHRAFAPIMRRRPKDTALYLVDQPGCGASADPEAWTTEAIAAPIVDLVRNLEEEHVTIAGTCSGAVVGMFVALAVPHRVQRLLLIDPFLEPPWYFKMFTLPLLGALFYFSTFANPIGRWIVNLSMSKKKRAGVDVTNGFAGANPMRALRYLEALVATPRPAARALRSLAPKTEIAIGSRTFRAVVRGVQAFRARYWRRVKVTVLDGAGHLPHIETPRALAAFVWPGQFKSTSPASMGSSSSPTDSSLAYPSRPSSPAPQHLTVPPSTIAQE